MVSAIVTVLLLAIMSAIIASFAVSAWRERRRMKKLSVQKTTLLAYASPTPTTRKLVYVPPTMFSASWYTKRRTLVSLGFFMMILLTFFVQSGLTEGSLSALTNDISTPLLKASQSVALQIMGHTTAAVTNDGPLNASMQLVRIDSASRAQYRTDYQWEVWSYSSCSGMAMTMVMDSYGRHLIAGDVLQEEANLGVWNVNLGLLNESGITQTAAYYGFNSDESHTRTLQNIIALANKGEPVIVGVRDNYYFPGGHILVVRGGDSQNVYLADSSPANFQHMSYSMFLGMWHGFSAVLTPRV